MPETNEPSSADLCDRLLATGEPRVWEEMHAALVAIARRHGLIETPTADNADSVRLSEAGVSHGTASDATIWLRNAIKERLAMVWDDVPDGVGAALTHLFTALDAQAVLRRWLAEQPNHGDDTPTSDPAPTFTPITKGATEFMFERMNEPGHYDDDPDFTVNEAPHNTPEPDPAPELPTEIVAAVDAAVDRHLDQAKAEFEAALHRLLADWFEGALGRISEHGHASDWPALIEDAKARHEALRIPWSNTFVPGYVREIMAMDDDDTPEPDPAPEFTFTPSGRSTYLTFLCTREDGKQCLVRLKDDVWESASATGEPVWIASPTAGAAESREGAAYSHFFYAHTIGGEFYESPEED